jgi:hypothetical protein
MGAIVLKNEKLAYLAGLLDGEGGIGIYRNGKNSPRPSVTLRMTHHETVKIVSDFFGGCCRPEKKAKPRQPTWKWSVTWRKAYLVLKSLRPWLVTKATEADIIIGRYEKKWGAALMGNPPSLIIMHTLRLRNNRSHPMLLLAAVWTSGPSVALRLAIISV